MELLVLVEHLLALDWGQLAELAQLDLAHAIPVVQTDRMHRDVCNAVVLPVENCMHVVMQSLLAVPQHKSLALHPPPLLQTDLQRRDFLYLLVKKQEIQLQDVLLVIRRDLGLDSEVADIVELHLFFVVPEWAEQYLRR